MNLLVFLLSVISQLPIGVFICDVYVVFCYLFPFENHFIQSREDMDNLSHLERLPCELFWKIVDETPESVFALILVNLQIFGMLRQQN